MVEPVHPFQGGKLDRFDTAPRGHAGGSPRLLVRLRHKPNGDPAHAVFPAKIANPSISQKPRHYWVSAFCDAVVLEAVDGFGEGIVVTVADAADRRLDAGIGQALGIGDRAVRARLNPRTHRRRACRSTSPGSPGRATPGIQGRRCHRSPCPDEGRQAAGARCRQAHGRIGGHPVSPCWQGGAGDDADVAADD